MENKKVEKVLSIIYETLMWLGTIALLIGFIGQTIMSFNLINEVVKSSGMTEQQVFEHWLNEGLITLPQENNLYVAMNEQISSFPDYPEQP